MPPALPDDATLLRAFHPVVRFTRGEYFFPVSVEDYVRHAALWAEREDGESELLVPPRGARPRVAVSTGPVHAGDR